MLDGIMWFNAELLGLFISIIYIVQMKLDIICATDQYLTRDRISSFCFQL